MSATLIIRFAFKDFPAELTLEGENGKELLDRLPTIVAALQKAGAEPPPAPALALPPTPPVATGEGEALPEKKICPLHHVEMQRRVGKGGDVWYSHKAVDPQTGKEYWCRGESKDKEK